MQTKVSREVATSEVNTWLDKQRVKPRVRVEKEKQIGSLVEAVMYGECSINDEGFMVQSLNFPVGGLNELVYSNRIQLDDVRTKTKNVGDDSFTVIAAYVSSCTGIAMGVLKGMDNSDMGLASDIMAFF